MSTELSRPAVHPEVVLGWLITAAGFAAGLAMAGDLPSPAGPLLAWAGIAAGALLAGGSLPVTVITGLFAFELLRSLVSPRA